MRVPTATLLAASLLAIPLLGWVAAASMADYAVDGPVYSAATDSGLAVTILSILGGMSVLSRPHRAVLQFLADGSQKKESR